MFKNPTDPDNIFISKKIHEWVNAKMELPKDTEIQILESGCGDGSCLCVQTQIKIASISEKCVIIGKPLSLIRKWDIERGFENY